MLPFTPGNTILVTASTNSAATLLAVQSLQVMLYNAGTVTVYVAFGASTVAATVPTGTASANSIPIPAGAIMVFTRAVGQDYIACITASSTAVLTATAGAGE